MFLGAACVSAGSCSRLTERRCCTDSPDFLIWVSDISHLQIFKWVAEGVDAIRLGGCHSTLLNINTSISMQFRDRKIHLIPLLCVSVFYCNGATARIFCVRRRV